MDNFKKYLQAQKDQLDTEIPDPKIWNRIEQDLQFSSSLKSEEKAKVVPLKRWWMAAAGILILIVCSAIFFFSQKNNHQFDIVSKDSPSKLPTTVKDKQSIEKKNEIPDSLHDNAPEVKSQLLARVDTKESKIKSNKKENNNTQYVVENVEVGNFSQIIAYQRQYISTLPIYGEEPSYFNDFKSQLHQMDNDEKDVRKEMKKNGINPNQIELLINIYQQKITLLKQLNQEILRVNKSYHQNQSLKDSVNTDNPHFLNL